MNYKETLSNSIARIEEKVKKSIVVLESGVPLPSWIEVSPIEYCSRKCVFCPKSDDSLAPNQISLQMTNELAQKIADQLAEIGFTGTVMLAGYGEPMAAKNINELVRIFSNVCNTEITTNGDFLKVKTAQALVDSGINKIIVSLYDGPKQIEKFTKIFNEAGIDKSLYVLRDRWYKEDDSYGVKLTNRAGVVTAGNQPEVKQDHQCFYCHYSMMLDWNGDVFLCTQDWQRKVKMGNLAMQDFMDVWTGKAYVQYRKNLYQGKRKSFPCLLCNADGTLHGKEHAKIWMQHYEKK